MFCENKQKLNFSLTIKIDRKIFCEKSYRFSDTEEKSIDTLVCLFVSNGILKAILQIWCFDAWP